LRKPLLCIVALRFNILLTVWSSSPLSALQPPPEIERGLVEARESASKYHWTAAAEKYRQVLNYVNRAEDPGRAAQVAELLAESYFKAAFQSDTRQEFKHPMALSEKTQEELAGHYERVDSLGLAKRAQARALFSRFWLEDQIEDQRTALEKCIQLALESSQILEVQKEKKFLVENLRDLVTYWEQGVQTAPDRNRLVDHIEKALETAWRVIDEFHGLEDQVELETINLLARLEVYVQASSNSPDMMTLRKSLQESYHGYRTC
jgi:hypothetical protein